MASVMEDPDKVVHSSSERGWDWRDYMCRLITRLDDHGYGMLFVKKGMEPPPDLLFRTVFEKNTDGKPGIVIESPDGKPEVFSKTPQQGTRKSGNDTSDAMSEPVGTEFQRDESLVIVTERTENSEKHGQQLESSGSAKEEAVNHPKRNKVMAPTVDVCEFMTNLSSAKGKNI